MMLKILATSVLLVASAARVMTDREWEKLVSANAAANPHATFSQTEDFGFRSRERWPLATDVLTSGPGTPMPEAAALLASIASSPGANPSIDWRDKGAVTRVKNQGAFGTCWSFAAAENLEGLNVRQGNALQNISNQELIDCCKDCAGRAADASFDFMLSETDGRLDTQESYPYEGKAGKCKEKNGTPSTMVLHTHGRIQDDGTGDPIVAGLVKYGPMGHGVDADCFAGYKGGVITNCTKSSIDHAVLMVGAGTTSDGIDYYIIKNSWGAKWGEHGYVRVARGTPKQCGIGSTVWTM